MTEGHHSQRMLTIAMSRTALSGDFVSRGQRELFCFRSGPESWGSCCSGEGGGAELAVTRPAGAASSRRLTMIKAILIFNNHGKPRLSKFYQRYVRGRALGAGRGGGGRGVSVSLRLSRPRSVASPGPQEAVERRGADRGSSEEWEGPGSGSVPWAAFPIRVQPLLWGTVQLLARRSAAQR